MSYEIPQELEYKEKIMFGLTFKQLAYVFAFAPIMFVIFFKTSLYLPIKIALMSMFGGLGIGFIFLDLDKHVRNWYYWFRSKRIEIPSKLITFIPIKEVRDQLIIKNDGKKLALLRITPINFSIKPEESKQAISIGFQKFLNSLDFPIQIIMNTENLDLEDYFKEVEKKINNSERFKELFQGYKNHLESISKEKDVMNRVFYLVIQEKSDINIQLQICQTKLSNIGIKSVRLKDYEIKDLLKRFFVARPETREVENVSKEKR